MTMTVTMMTFMDLDENHYDDNNDDEDYNEH